MKNRKYRNFQYVAYPQNTLKMQNFSLKILKIETLRKNGQLCYITRFMTPNILEMANGDFFTLEMHFLGQNVAL